jgi:hypothetical protein
LFDPGSWVDLRLTGSLLGGRPSFVKHEFKLQNLSHMNSRLHSALRYLYALVLLGSGAKHLYNIYWGDASIMATGYPEPEAQAFVFAVLETKFLLPFICTAKLIAGVVMVLPGREQLGVLMAFPYAVGMLMWGIFMVPSHLVIMSVIFALNAALVYANMPHYRVLLKA